MNENELPIRGNICPCGNCWFCLDIPESDPDRCPYCSRKIDATEICEDDYTAGYQGQEEIPEDIQKTIDKATGASKVTFATKICDFCANILFFDEVDAPKAQYCPYCDGHLIDESKYSPLSGLDPSNDVDIGSELLIGVDINEMIGQNVSVKFKSINPFAKAEICSFQGIDIIVGMVKFKMEIDGSLVWKPLANIKSITIITK